MFYTTLNSFRSEAVPRNRVTSKPFVDHQCHTELLLHSPESQRLVEKVTRIASWLKSSVTAYFRYMRKVRSLKQTDRLETMAAASSEPVDVHERRIVSCTLSTHQKLKVARCKLSDSL